MAAPTKKAVSTSKRKTPVATGARTVRPAAANRAPKRTPATRRDRATEPDDFKTSMLNIRLRDQLKQDATKTLAEIGISLPEAVRVFLSRVVNDGGFPFRLEVPNAATRRAMENARDMTTRGRFSTAEELFDDLEKGGRP